MTRIEVRVRDLELDVSVIKESIERDENYMHEMKEEMKNISEKIYRAVVKIMLLLLSVVGFLVYEFIIKR